MIPLYQLIAEASLLIMSLTKGAHGTLEIDAPIDNDDDWLVGWRSADGEWQGSSGETLERALIALLNGDYIIHGQRSH